VTHERDPGEREPSFLCAARKTASFYFAFPIMRLFGPLVSSLRALVPLSRSLLLHERSSRAPPPSPFFVRLSSSSSSPSPSPGPPPPFCSLALLHFPSLSIYFSLFGAVDRVTSNVNQSAGIVASFLRQWFSISPCRRDMWDIVPARSRSLIFSMPSRIADFSAEFVILFDSRSHFRSSHLFACLFIMADAKRR